MGIDSQTDDQLSELERKYRVRGITKGGPYTLQEILEEKAIRALRKPSEIKAEDIVRSIIVLSKQSKDSLVTYLELWQSLKPNTPWKGNYSQRTISKLLDTAIFFCIKNNLPILTVLIVVGSNRTISRRPFALAH